MREADEVGKGVAGRGRGREGGGEEERVVVGAVAAVQRVGVDWIEAPVEVEVERDGLKDEALDADQVRAVRLLGGRVALADAVAALEEVRDLVGGDLDLAQLLERVLELGGDEEGRERDVLRARVGTRSGRVPRQRQPEGGTARTW